MSQRLRVILAGAVVTAGCMGAYWFGRTESPEPSPADPVVAESMVLPRRAPVPLGSRSEVVPNETTARVRLHAPDLSGGFLPSDTDALPPLKPVEPLPELAATFPTSRISAVANRRVDSPIEHVEPIPSPFGQPNRVVGRVATPSVQAPPLHRIVDGDTLTELALRYLGSAERADAIYQANRDRLARPDVLPIGTELTIPVSQPDRVESNRLVPLRSSGQTIAAYRLGPPAGQTVDPDRLVPLRSTP